MGARSAVINVMARAAEKAGRALVRDFGEVEQLQVSAKGPSDFVSQADHRAEKLVRQELQKARPRFGLHMEESGVRTGEDTSHYWLVDPLDGTTNFLHGLPHFAVSIALVENNEIIAAVVYDPVKDDMFWAERGQGAFLNYRRIRVSARRRLAEAVFATGIPHRGIGDHSDFLPRLERVMGKCAGVRRFGAAALDLAYVAAGRYEGFFEAGLNPWDIAAGVLLVREAGGLVTDYAGMGVRLTHGDVIAGNAQLQPALVELVTGTGRAAQASGRDAAKS